MKTFKKISCMVKRKTFAIPIKFREMDCKLFDVRSFFKIILAIVIIVFNPHSCKAYSVLTHEAIIDANWDHILLPLLKQKFPAASAEELKIAHAYA